MNSYKNPSGFASPAADEERRSLNLHDLLIRHEAATFFVRVESESMASERIERGDLLVVDRAITAKGGNVVVAIWQGEFVVRKLEMQGGAVVALWNGEKRTLVRPESDFSVWGVVTYVIHKT